MTMEQEIADLEGGMKEELKGVKDKYVILKADVKKKYKEIEKQKKKQEKEETKKLRKSIPKSLKILVWDKNIGKEKGIGECDVCKSEIDSKNFECGHIKSVKDGGETNIENLLPICSSCNKSMGTQNLHEFKEKYFKNQNVKKESKKTTPVEEFIETKLKYNEGLVDEEIIMNNNMNNNRGGGAMNDMFYGSNTFVQKIKTGRKVKRAPLKLETIYNAYRNWLEIKYPYEFNDKQYEGCFGSNDTLENLKNKISKKFGESNNMADFCNPSERGLNIPGWGDIEII